MKVKRLHLVIGAIVASIIVMAGTVAVLQYVNDSSSVTPSDGPAGTVGEAQKLEDEADELMHTEPSKALEKLQRAHELYKEAGDNEKASEVERNASTAQSIKELYEYSMNNNENPPADNDNPDKAASEATDPVEPTED